MTTSTELDQSTSTSIPVVSEGKKSERSNGPKLSPVAKTALIITGSVCAAFALIGVMLRRRKLASKRDFYSSSRLNSDFESVVIQPRISTATEATFIHNNDIWK